MATNSVEICNNALALIGARRITALSDPSKEGRSCNDNYDICRKTLLRLHPWNFAMTRVELTGVDITSIVAGPGGAIYITTGADNHNLTTGDRASVVGVIGTNEANMTGEVTVAANNIFYFNDTTFENTYVSGGMVGPAPAYEYLFKWPLPSGFMRVCTVSDINDNQLTHREFKIEGNYLLTNASVIRLEYVANATTTTLFDPLFDEALAAMIADKIAYKITGSDTVQDKCSRHLKKVLQASRFVDTVENPSVPLDADEWIRSRWDTNQGYVRDPMT